MKRSFLLFTIYLLFNAVNAQVDTTYWPSGEILRITTSENGKFIGPWTSYQKNGNIEVEGIYTAKGKSGEWKSYHYTGELASVSIYENGDIYNYTIRSYYVGGQLKLTAIAEMGFYKEYTEYYRHGVVKSSLEDKGNGASIQKDYFENGALKQVGNFSSRKKTGIWKTYYQTGKLKRTEDYTEGKSPILWKEYYQNGQLMRTEECVAGIKVRDLTEFYLTGELKRTGRGSYSYPFSRYPSKLGEWKDFHKNGQVQSVYQFKRNQKLGVWKKFHEDGSLAQIGEFKDGQPIGFWKDFYPNGKLKTIGKYSANSYRMEKSGFWKDYHENGELKRTCWHGYRGRGKQTEYYENGVLKRIGSFGEVDNEAGEWMDYRKNGKLKRVIEYHEGIIVSPIKTYFFNEKIVFKKKNYKVPYTYKDRTAQYKMGKSKFHYPNGKLHFVQKCKGRNEKNVYLKYHVSGSLAEKEKVKKGDSTGYQKMYFPKGKHAFKRIFLNVRAEGKTENRLKIGEWKTYHKNGNLRQIEMYRSGKLMEVKSCFDKEGKEQAIGTLKDGTGSVFVYNKNGEAIHLREYEEGVLLRR